MTLDAPSKIALVKTEADEFVVTVKSLSNEGKPVWIVAQYNPEWLKVIGPGILSQHDLPPDLFATNPDESMPSFPGRFEEHKLAATPGLSADGDAEIRFKITRLPNQDAGGSTNLILKAISGDTFVRHEVNVTLPGRELLEITVDADSDHWEHTRPCPSCPADGIKLFPLPNQEKQNFAFNVVNHAKVKKSLEVQFLIPNPDRWPETPISLPAGAQPVATALELLKPIMPLHKLGPAFKIDLPATGQPQRIKLPPSDEQIDPEANLLVQKGVAADQFKPILLKHGLLIWLKDLQSGEVTIRRIQIVPQRPERYLTVTARYDARFNGTTKRLDILVKANNPNSVPEESITVSADVEGVSAPQGSKLSGKVTASKDLELYAYLMDNAPQEIMAYVHVDKNPRAFIFRVTRDATNDNIPLVNDPNVRIVSPAKQTPFNAGKVNSIPVRIQVDATQTFDDENNTAFIEVGIDDKRNGELQDDEFTTLYSDRQVDISATRLTPDGILSLHARVDDFQLDLPTEGLSDVRADLLARLVINGESKWSDPVEILLDGTPPEIHVDDMPDQVVSGEDVEVNIRATQEDLSGVARVEAIFESLQTNDPKESKWEVAKEDGNGGWVAKLKTDGLEPGPQVVLIRAKDKVVNLSSVQSEKINVVAKQEVSPTSVENPQPVPDVGNTVTGKILYVGRAVPAEVTLESSTGARIGPQNTGADGSYTFSKVLPGKYVLNAKSRAEFGGSHREAKAVITVPGPVPTPLNLR